MNGKRVEFYIKFNIGERVFLLKPDKTYKLHIVGGYKFVKIGKHTDLRYYLEDVEDEWKEEDLCGEGDMGGIFKPPLNAKGNE